MSGIGDLLHDLTLPYRSFRIAALEKIIREGKGDEALRALEKRLAVEDDDECRSLLEHALAIVRERTASSGKKAETAGEFADRFLTLDARGKMGALSNLPPEQLPELSQTATTWFFQETDVFVRAALLRTFRPVWPREALKPLLESLSHPAQTIRFAALETLVHRAPQELQRNLPALLTHEDPRVWALGIQGLATIDAEEAIAHLARMLESREPATILAALRCSVFLPFRRLRMHFLRAVLENDDATILGWIEEFLATNPDPEVPFRLSEIELRAVGAKREILAGMTRRVTEELHRSRLLGDRWPAYREKLDEWRAERQAALLVQNLLQSWIQGDLPRERVVEILAPEWGKPVLRRSLGKALEEIPPGEIRTTLEIWLQSGLPANGSEGPSSGEPPAGLATDDREEARALILPLLANSSRASVAEKIAAVRAAHRLGLAEAADQIRPLLGSSDPTLVVSALRFLAEFDFDRLMPHLGTFFRARNSRICFTALRILRDHDPQQSLALVRTIFREAKGPRFEEILGFLVMYEFSQIRDLLLGLLAHPPTKDVFTKALLLFKANPAPENLYVLYCLEKDLETTRKAEAAEQVRVVRTGTFEILLECSRMETATLAVLEEEFARQRRLEKEEKQIPKPYGVRTLYPPKDDAGSDSWAGMPRSLSFAGVSRLLSLAPKMTISGLALLAGVAFLFTRSSSPVPDVKRPQPLVSKMMIIEGTTRKPNGAGMVIRASDGKEYRLNPPPGKALPELPPDINVRATIVPYRTEGDGSIRGICWSLAREIK